jgi:hydroxyacylglutathione hydrolase
MTLAVEQLSLGPASTNCYVVRAIPDNGEVVVIDPAADARVIQEAAERAGGRVAAILLTHSHFDHLGALADLAESTGAPVWLPRDEESEFRRPTLLPPGYTVRAFEGEATLVAGGETVVAGGIAFEVTPVPGHSAGHVAYHADGALFSGDVLFAGGVGRTDLPGGDWDTLLASIQRLAGRYPADTVVYSGHGPATSLGDELQRNPFLAELRSA